MPEIKSLYLNSIEYADARWRIMQSHKVGIISKDTLEKIVREKEVKAAEYQACDAFWLLIVVDGMNAAQEQEIRIDTPYTRSNVFEQILVYHTFGYIVSAKL
jgi:hypothetical protein